MQPYGRATRRFYLAFHRWNTFTPYCATEKPWSRIVSRRQSHLSTTRSNVPVEQITRDDLPPNIQTRTSNGDNTEQPPSSVSRGSRDGKVQVKLGRVEDALELPFNDFQPNQYAVRSRSFPNVGVEIAVPVDTLRRAVVRFGRRLRRLRGRTGVTIEARNIFHTVEKSSRDHQSRLQVQSVLISGEEAKVEKTSKVILNSVFTPTDMRDWFGSLQHVSHLSRHSDTLRPFEVLLRQYFSTGVTVELSAPEEAWSIESQQVRELSFHARRKGTRMEIGQPELRPLNNNLTETAPARSVLLSGAHWQVFSTCESLLLLLKNAEPEPSPSPNGHRDEEMPAVNVDAIDPMEQVKIPSYYCAIELEKGPSGHNKAVAFLSSNRELAIRRIMKSSGCGIHRKLNTIFFLTGTHWEVDAGLQLFKDTVNNIYRGLGIPHQDINILEFGLISHMSFNLRRVLRGGKDHTPDHTSDITSEGKIQPIHSEKPQPVSEILSITAQEHNLIIELRGDECEQIVVAAVNPLNSAFSSLVKETGCRTVYVAGAGSIVAKGSRNALQAFERQAQQLVQETCIGLGIPSSNLTIRTQLVSSEQNEERASPGSDRDGYPSRSDAQQSGESSQLREDLRIALRALSHPVVLVTAQDTIAEGQSKDIAQLEASRGVTISSFSTVSLDPYPIITFNLKVPSRSWDAIRFSGQLHLHLLAATPQGAAIAHVFTQPYEQGHLPFQKLQEVGVRTFVFPHSSPPQIIHSEAVLAHIGARLLPDHCRHVGDHVIVVAEVNSCYTQSNGDSQGPSETGVNTKERAGLGYSMMVYRRRGAPIENSTLSAFQPGVRTDQTQASDSGTETIAESVADDPCEEGTTDVGSTEKNYTNTSASNVTALGKRFYSTSSRVEENKRRLAEVLEPGASKMTVADMFQHTSGRPRRVRDLVNYNNIAKLANHMLEVGQEDGVPLTVERRAQLEHVQALNSRNAAKILARYSAQDLGFMLDKGRVYYNRAQSLESSIEAGQAVLIQESNMLRELFKQGKIDAEEFRTAKDSLQGDETLFATETMRLKQFVYEDEGEIFETVDPVKLPESDDTKGSQCQD